MCLKGNSKHTIFYYGNIFYYTNDLLTQHTNDMLTLIKTQRQAVPANLNNAVNLI